MRTSCLKCRVAYVTSRRQEVRCGILLRLPGTPKQWLHHARSRKGVLTPHHDRPSPLLLTSSTRARRGQETENGDRPHGKGGARRSEGSNVGCSHAAGCPLFPLLRASLQGWRDYYCDSEDQWHGCARYQMSLTGDRVPISLLPNGAYARHLEQAPAEAEPRPRPVPPSQPSPWPAGNATWSQPAPARRAEPPEYVPAAPEPVTRLGPASPTIPVSHYRTPPSPHLPEPPRPPSRRAGHKPRPKRGWWARFTEWMGGPA